MGKGIHREWGIFSLPQGLWKIRCKKEEVKAPEIGAKTEEVETVEDIEVAGESEPEEVVETEEDVETEENIVEVS